ncbi:hypothetical protein ACYOEI_05860 [Singulisphaera rosea]
MARLHRKADGGYCIVGQIYGAKGSAAICTWQVTQEGIAYLRSRRVEDRGFVSVDTLEDLVRLHWIYTGGTASPGAVDPLAAGDVDLIERLVDWAWDGGVTGFDHLVHRSPGAIDNKLVDRIFSDGLISWLRPLVGDRLLAELDGISYSDFNVLVGDRLERFPGALHRLSGLYCENRLVWRLAEIIGKVGWQVAASHGCPCSWRESYPILGYLFDRLSRQDEPLPAVEKPKRPRRRSLHPTARPFLRWDVDGQQLIAILPGQSLSPGQELIWSVTQAEVVQPEVFAAPDRVRVGEVRSQPLDPASRYTIRVELRPLGEMVEDVFQLPPPDSSLVLFSAEGRLLPHEPGTSHPKGVYLALAPKARAGAVAAIRGVRVLEPVDYEPIGWHGWRGFRLELEEGADVGPYTIGVPGSRASWQAEDPPNHEVFFENTRPTWIDRWPRLWIDGVVHFAEAALEIAHESPRDEAAPGFRLWVGEQVSIGDDRGRAYLDLSAAPDLRDVYGSILLTCRLTALPEHPPLSLALVRLRPADFAYVEAPELFESCAAVQIRTEDSEVAPGAGTRIAMANGVCIAWPEDPLRSPSVTVILPGSGAELRIRTPVTRLRRLSRVNPLGPWETPPLTLRLSDIELEDRLRVELHREPEFEDGRPFCRLVGGAEVSSGDPCRVPNTYDIPLNRWRDSLGAEAAGTVQLRTTRGWMDLVCLQGRGAPPFAPAVVGEDVRQHDRKRLLCELESAVCVEDEAAALRDLGRCVARAEAADCPSPEQEILHLAAARSYLHLGLMSGVERMLERLKARGDLYEQTIIRSSYDLRRGAVPRSDIPRKGRELAEMPVSCPLQQLIIAEHHSRYACGKGGGVAMWQSCLRRLDSILHPIVGGDDQDTARSIDSKEALLLRGLALFMLGREPRFPEGLPTGGQWEWLPMLRSAARYLLQPFRWLPGRPVPPAAISTPPVFAEEYAELIRLALLQSAGNVAASGRLLSQFHGLTSDEFFGIDLLRLRQCRVENRNEEAGILFRRLLDWSRQNEHDALREVLLEETI